MYYRLLFTSVLENKSRKAEFPEGLIDHTPGRKLTLVERERGRSMPSFPDAKKRVERMPTMMMMTTMVMAEAAAAVGVIRRITEMLQGGNS